MGRSPRLAVQTSPYLRTAVGVPDIMRDVVLALVPVLVAAVWFFGPAALLVVGSCTLGAVLTEWVFTAKGESTLGDWSAILTGVVLGLTLPPGLPLWIAFVGGASGIGLGKLVWGGLGQNLFNPALVGRAFLQAAFPIALTTWPAPSAWGSLPGSTLAMPLMSPSVDVVTAATPLGAQKFSQELTELSSLVVGNTGGSLGETSAALLVVCGLWLAWRRAFEWRIPVAMLASVFVISAVLYALAPETAPPPTFMLGAGGLLFGAVFMATDPVTSPTTPKGAWIFGIGIGLLVVLIRRWGGLPEGVMYAILLMNSATPLVDRIAQPRTFGHGVKT